MRMADYLFFFLKILLFRRYECEAKLSFHCEIVFTKWYDVALHLLCVWKVQDSNPVYALPRKKFDQNRVLPKSQQHIIHNCSSTTDTSTSLVAKISDKLNTDYSTFQESGSLDCFGSQLNYENMNPFRHFARTRRTEILYHRKISILHRTAQHRKNWTYFHASSEIRTNDPRVREVQNISTLHRARSEANTQRSTQKNWLIFVILLLELNRLIF